jgi:hypothetical protein
MSPEQRELRAIYERQWHTLFNAFNALPIRNLLSFPLLLDLDAHGYLSARVRLMVVGQQTKGWVGNWRQNLGLGPDPIQKLCSTYSAFALGKNYYRTPFWVAAHQVNRVLNPDANIGFAWSNLLKLDEAGQRPSPPVEKVLLESFNVLPGECRVAKPHVVLFFTGPEYDDTLRNVFQGTEFVTVAGYDVRALARLIHPHLPWLSFRLYHPNYLRRAGKWLIIEELGRRILDELGPRALL